jgi:hypothetical protein
MIRRALATAMLVGTICLWRPFNALGEYVFPNGVAATENQIVTDVQSGRLDSSSFEEAAASSTLRSVSIAPKTTQEILHSPLRRICPVLSVQNADREAYAFRSVHDLGNLDWVASIENPASKKISALVFMANESGPPSIMPALSSNSTDNITPSVEMDCSSEEERKAAAKEIEEACKKPDALCGLDAK